MKKFGAGSAERGIEENRNFDVDAELAEEMGDGFGVDAGNGERGISGFEFDSDKISVKANAGNGGGSEAEEGVEDEVAWIGGGGEVGSVR